MRQRGRRFLAWQMQYVTHSYAVPCVCVLTDTAREVKIITYWGVESYTRVACGSSTVMTGLPALRADIAAFAGEEEQFDDITMPGFICRAPVKMRRMAHEREGLQGMLMENATR